MKKMDTESRYIRKRKFKAFLTFLFYCMLRIFPIKDNKLVFTTFEGDGGYCCNPRYIAEELIKRDKDYEIVWLVNNTKKEIPEGIQKVKNTYLNRAYHLVTAKVWVDNSRKAFGTAKRKKQLYIQTWHAGVASKPIGKFRGKLFPKMAHIVSAYDSKMIDYVTSNSEWCTRLYPKMLLYHGNIIKTGSPRCDILINNREEIYESVRCRYGIPKDAKVVMFAPTFRGGSQKGNRQVFVEEPSLDFLALTEALEKKFGGSWFIFMRLHPQLAAQLEKVPLKNHAENMIDVSQADDMNELLCASDVLVTDYSSSAFDAICAYIPVFLYADDLEAYVKERGKLMWDMRKLPFSMAETNGELVENIAGFDEDGYRKKINKFQEMHGVVESGSAGKQVSEIIELFVKGKKYDFT